MKQLKIIYQSVLHFFKILLNLKKYRESKEYERLLKKGIINREIEKIKLIREASKLIPKKFKKGKSIYIPLSFASKIKIKTAIEAEYGSKMKILGISISDDLKFN